MKKILFIASCLPVAGILNSCSTRTTATNNYCQSYASKAVAQHQQNLQYQCGFQGLRWNNDLKGQHQWCNSVTPDLAQREHVQREQSLKSCFSQRPPGYIANNQPPIPAQCIDRQQNYTPIRRINSRNHYQNGSTTYQPIIDPKGYIQADLNYDRINDYVFIEQKQKQTRLAFCTSQPRTGQLKRKATRFKIYSEANPTTEISSQRIEYKKGKLLITDQYQEHNWGTDSIQGTYTFVPSLDDLTLTHFAKTSTSGDGYRSNRFEEYDLKRGRYHISATCGQFETGCQNQQTQGQLTPHSRPITLSQSPVSLSAEEPRRYATLHP
ncbi:MAG: Unknown protein [uncultured Thiotrichaceae bacterium]|uniref:Uncharacterized protein n=1 Tax=uncultured Thiotrichaceae bacterium TaxID=298394 RepID=A0A6S6T615_9GAMM|nr:MAG: Unknown protein [uncultured Thiotrichaceae bacterium]